MPPIYPTAARRRPHPRPGRPRHFVSAAKRNATFGDELANVSGTKSRVKNTLIALLCGALTLLSISRLSANVVLDWDAVMMSAVRADNTGPTLSSRNLAILHVSIFDAVNSIVRSHQPYAVLLDPAGDASPEAAASAAGYEVVKVLYPGLRAQGDEVYATWFAEASQTDSTTNGINLGVAVARLILESRVSDGASTDLPYIPSDEPGHWRRTPPFFRPPVTPQWRYVTPFAIQEIEPFVPPPPPPLDSPEYARAFEQVKMLGSKTNSTRTPEQTQIAIFWSDFSYTAMPPGHWHEIAASIARSRDTSLVDSARMMALLSIAQADGAIICWEAKYRYDLWRPVTAIQRADEDGNPETAADPGWDHLLAAPPFPAYTSGHSTFSKASAQVLAKFYGSDEIAFTASSDSLPGVFRNFTSLAACADEVGMSRIYGGIHFQFDNESGKKCGREIADYVTANFLLPNNQLPLVRLERLMENSVAIRLHGHAGRHVVLERSTDLNIWSALATNAVLSGGVVITAPKSAVNAVFFRARELP
jgi:hypothetical protein